MADPRPNFTIARICLNCFYGVFGEDDYYGPCKLPQVSNPDAETLKTHYTCTCDAHTWKKSRSKIQKPAAAVGATLPDDAL